MRRLISVVGFAGVLVWILISTDFVGARPAPPQDHSTYNSTDGVALNGYDVVAYFTEGRPVKGSATHVHWWQGVRWHFASAAHRDLFAAAPEKYAPQFGGFCAYGVSRGYAVAIDPNAWSVANGKLYLNYSLSVQRTWNKERDSYIRKAEMNWPAVAAKQAKEQK